MRENYAKVFQSMFFSSVWEEDDSTRIVWLTLMVMADKFGEVAGNVHSLARTAKVSPDVCRRALEILLGPDPSSRTETDEGRRLKAIEGGWVLVNHSVYTSKATEEDRRDQDARRQKRFRDRQTAKKNCPEGVTSESESAVPRNAASRSVTDRNAKSGMEMEMEMEPEREADPPPDSPSKKAKPKRARRKKADPFTPAAIRGAVGRHPGLRAVPGFTEAVEGWSQVLREKKKLWATPEALEGHLLKLEKGHLSDALEIVELCRVNAWTGWIAGRDQLLRERGQSPRSHNQAATRGPEHEPF